MFAKKNLVAAAALLAIAGAAQAQVKVYGAVDLGFGSTETAHAKNESVRKTEVLNGGMMTSFIGFSAAEDLGGGLKAEVTLESFINADTGANGPNMAGGFWGRGSNIALSGGFGKVALGQYDNPLFTSGYTYNPFGSSMVVSPTMRHFYSGGDASALGFDTGFVNSITYESPVVQGFNATLQFAPKETTKAGTANSYAAAGVYNMGPLSATLTYVKAGRTTTDVGVAPTAYRADQKVMDLGASYDLGAAKLFAQFTSVKTTASSAVSPDTGKVTAINTGVDVKHTIYQLGVSAPVTEKLTAMASFGSSKVKDGGSDKVFTLGADYLLSKRTDVYVAFMNNSATDLTSGQTLVGGIKHAF